MKPTLWRIFLVGASLSLFLARPSAAAEKTGLQGRLNNGYSLLHDLYNQEEPLKLILVIKTTPPDVADLLKKISKTASDDLATLDRFQAHDKAIHFDRSGLPQFENDTRAAIKEDKQHNLLFGTKGKSFVQAILLAQIEAATYAIHVSDLLAQSETNTARAKDLDRMSKKWTTLRVEAFRLLHGT